MPALYSDSEYIICHLPQHLSNTDNTLSLCILLKLWDYINIISPQVDNLIDKSERGRTFHLNSQQNSLLHVCQHIFKIQRLPYLFVFSLIEICVDKFAILVNPLIYVQPACATNNQFISQNLSIQQFLSSTNKIFFMK